MTSENFYRSALDKALSEYKDAYLMPLSKYKNHPSPPDDMMALFEYQKSTQTMFNQLSSIIVQPVYFNALDLVNKHYADLSAQEESKKQNILNQSETRKQIKTNAHNAQVEQANSYNASLLEPIQAKHRELLDYKDDLEYIFKYYDISPLDLDISDNVTIDEFDVLIDESIKVCLKYKKRGDSLFQKIISPLEGETNIQFTLGLLFLGIVIVYLLLPILAIPAFGYLFFNVHNMYKDLEKLRIARVLMSQIDYKRFVPKEDFKEVEFLDLSDIESETEEQLQTVIDYSSEKEEAVQAVQRDMNKINQECLAAKKSLEDEYSTVKRTLSNYLNEAQKKLDDKLKDYKPFPTEQSNSVVMRHDYALGRTYNRLDVRIDVPCLNIVFNSTDRVTAINTMKLYLANILLSVRVKQLTIEIFDPKNMCAEFTEFFTQETKPYIKPNNMTIDKLMDTYRKYSQDNILVLDGKSIDEFNQEAQEKELVPKEYKLLILISEVDKVTKEEIFKEYFKYSASSGVMIWLLDDKKYPNSIFVDGSYNQKGEGIRYTTDLGKQAVQTFINALASYKDTGIDYVTKFGDIFIPREKWWTFDTISGINMPYGLENGDPTRGLNVAPVIGDANVHSLLGGATGAGKSAAINQLLISLITMYPPSELQLVYIDFKNVEAAKFTKGYDPEKQEWFDDDYERQLKEAGTYYSRLSRIPHLRIISGTTDGEYALSVFEFLMKEMARRQEIINKFGVTKVEEMRKQILSKYNQEHNGNPKKGTWAEMRKDWAWYKPNVYDKYGDLPRLLVIFDEFQVMYNPEFVDNRTIDMINGKITAITKLARAMSCHFWFTSQSMRGTMSKDTMANFSLRGALRCTTEVSQELIGNDAAGQIKQKFGFMYTNDSAGQNKDANRLWRVPFLDEKAMPKYIDQLIEMLPQYNEKHLMADFYDEKILVPSKELVSWYKQYPDTFGKAEVMILGERANFSTNKAPVAIALQNDGGENILIAAFDRSDMLNLTMTTVTNIMNKTEDCTLIMNVQDKETYTLLDVENLVDPKFLPLASPDQDVPELIDALNTIVDSRLSKGGPYSTIYVLLVQWERAPGISVDINYKLSDVFKDLLRKAPGVGVHFIFACREKLDMQRMIPGACNHKIGAFLPKDYAFFLNTPKVEKLPDASKDAGLFAIYEYGTSLNKFRIYQHTFTKQLASREIVL